MARFASSLTVLVFLLLPLQTVVAQEIGRDDSVWSGQPFEVVWQTDAGRAVTSPLQVTPDGYLVAVTTDRKIYCHKVTTGDRKWRRRFKRDLTAAPAVVGGISETGFILLQEGHGREGKLRGLRSRDGKDAWEKPWGDRLTWLEPAGDAVLTLGLSGTLHSLDPVDGSENWKLDGFGWDAPRGVLDGDDVFVVARADSVYSVDAESGEIRWRSAVPGRFMAPPSKNGDILAVTTVEGQLYQVDARTGEVIPSGTRRSMQLQPPVQRDASVITVSSDGWVQSGRFLWPLGVDEALDWEIDLDEAVACPAAMAGEFVLVATAAGRLVALRADNGTQVWSLELSDRLAAAPILSDGYLVVATNQGDIFVYNHD